MFRRPVSFLFSPFMPLPMRVSVIIPALNEEKNIEATLQSIRRQNYRHPIELIVADGHSTDKTVSIAKKYCDAVVQETTHTIAAGRQAGARAAHGELLLYTDADTLVDKDWVRNMAAAFDDERVVAAFGMIQPKEASGIEHFMLTWGVYSMAAIFNALGMDYTYGNNMALRKTAFDKIGGFNIYLVTGEDTEIMVSKLQMIFSVDAIAVELGILRKFLVFFQHLRSVSARTVIDLVLIVKTIAVVVLLTVIVVTTATPVVVILLPVVGIHQDLPCPLLSITVAWCPLEPSP